MKRRRFAVVLWLGTMAAGTAQAQLEGTLFTEPEEREYLDYLRQEFLRTNPEGGFDIEDGDIPEIPQNAVPVEEDTRPVEYSFGGVMTRRDGSHGIWLDGVLLDETQLPEGFSVVTTGQMTSLRVVRDGQTYVLRPGQSVNLATGTVSEMLQHFAAPPATEQAPATAREPVAEELAVPAVADTAAATEPAGPDDAVETQLRETTAAANEDPGSILNDNVDGAVARLSDEEAEALAAALERREASRNNAGQDPGTGRSE